MIIIDDILKVLGAILTFIPIWIYNKLYSKFFTTASYEKMAERFPKFKKLEKVLDVGVGTGHPLSKIIHKFP